LEKKIKVKFENESELKNLKMNLEVKEEILGESSINTRALIKTLTKETIGNETSQAIIRIFETQYLGLKLFWVICLLGCGSLCFYLVAQTVITYLSYPVYTTTTIVHEVPTPFPKVTICNSVLATTEYAYEMINKINEEVSPGISIFDQRQMRILSWIDSTNIFRKVVALFRTRINSITFSEVERKKLVHSLEDVLLNCQFNGDFCSASDFIWKWDPLYGNCYVFNSGFNANGSKVNYKELKLPGALFGLSLNVYVGYNQILNPFNCGYFSYVPFSNSYGLNIFIENNTYLTNHKQNVIALNGGNINFMSIKRGFTSKLAKPYSDCDIDNKNQGKIYTPYYNLILNSPYQYNQDLCLIQCVQLQVIKLCNCSVPFYIDLYNSSCKTEAESWCTDNTLYSGLFASKMTDCISKCPLECNSTEISFMLTSQTFKGNGYAYLIEQSTVFTSDFNSTPITEITASEKFVQLNLYYESLAFTSSEDSPSMDIVSFLSNIGGTLGLFLGVSALSICEFIHVLIESLILIKHRKNNIKKQQI
jgi:hypothetical protein